MQTSSPVVRNSGMVLDEASRQICQSPLSDMMSDTEKGQWQLSPLFEPQESMCEDDVLAPIEFSDHL